MTRYATFRRAPGDDGLIHVGRTRIEPMTYLAVWLLGGMIAGIPIGLFILVLMCHGVHR